MKNARLDSTYADLEKFEANLTFDERRRLDMVRQLLNITSNYMEENLNIAEMLNIYSDVFALKEMPMFTDSLHQSATCFLNKETVSHYVQHLHNNQPQSFILFPVMSTNHVFGLVFRKEDHCYTCTIVNKGDRPGKHQFIEHIIPESQIKSMISKIQEKYGNVTTPQFYKTIQQFAISTRQLKIFNNEQKIGNCFIKEPETTLKYVFATRNFTAEDFRQIRSSKTDFHPKWEMLTVKMHKAFIDALSNRYPQISKHVNVEFQAYAQNKLFRELIEKGEDTKIALQKAFLSHTLPKQLPSEQILQKLMGQMNMDTLKRRPVQNALQKVVDTMSSREFQALYNTVISMHNLINDTLRYESSNIARNLENIEKIQLNFPVLCKQLKYEMHSLHRDLALKYFGKQFSEQSLSIAKQFQLCLDSAISLYPYNHMMYVLRGANKLHFANGNGARVKEAIEDFSKAIDLNDKQASLYFYRSLAYKAMGNREAFQHDLKTARRMDEEGIRRWTNMNLYELFVDYFNTNVVSFRPCQFKALLQNNRIDTSVGYVNSQNPLKRKIEMIAPFCAVSSKIKNPSENRCLRMSSV